MKMHLMKAMKDYIHSLLCTRRLQWPQRRVGAGTFHGVILPTICNGEIIASNEADPGSLQLTALEVVAVNERAYDMESEGVMVVPFGEVPVMVSINGRAIRGLQRIDAEAGNSMVADMSGMMGRLKQLFNGYPIYMGHPFHPIATEAAKYPDKKARGFIKSVEVANDAIRLIPKYNALGQGEVGDQQLIYHSPQWRMVPVMAANGAQEVKNGMPVFRPVALHSGGLTNDPNIPVPPLMAGNEAVAEESPLLATIKAALLKEGLIKEDDSDDLIIAAIGGLIANLAYARDAKQREADQCNALAAALPDAGNEGTHAELVTALIAANETLRGDLATAEAGMVAANEAAKAERTARANAVLEPLVKAGKVRLNQRDAVIGDLILAANEAAFQSVLSAAQKTPSKLQTAANLTKDAATKGPLIMAANEQSDRKAKRQQFVHDCLAEITRGRSARPGDQEAAWNQARRRQPDLFKD